MREIEAPLTTLEIEGIVERVVGHAFWEGVIIGVSIGIFLGAMLVLTVARGL